ncbi:conjugal transfer protein TraN [Vibrio parahaemolyticus]|nr:MULTISPECIES: conjugal transfer protein TraN [Vibrio]MDW1567917.1 conjugal transfer protein TraN [Vibrio sp. YT-15]MCR9821585.1 conjugal transfer protein TraN [Vibrio parahaemolyticus]MDF5108332.1 conjugal transfer protein TraN [Vibrio parahaemolyticus]MDF5143238.1 conjugal transfer protein TraN [Vibrio parahaemolyticus]MDF5153738.1 conjugal transfer protein TraN [Vibrio parahaemolyticus]
MFKKSLSMVLVVTYLTNLMSAAYVGILIGMLTASTPSFAALSLDTPIQMDYSCPSGYTLTGGKCIKKEVRSIRESCASGYSRSGDSCIRNESTSATVICATGFTFDTAQFPNQCSMLAGRDSVEEGSCSDRFEGTTRVGTACYYVEAPEEIKCPADAANATPTTVNMSCSSGAQIIGECNSSGTAYTTPDMRWKLNAPAFMCSRTLYKGVEKACDSGFSMEGDACTRTLSTVPSSSCKAGYYQKGNQCFPGEAEETCGAGTTMRYGVCVSPSGELSCPSGQYLEAGSNLCVKNRTDSNPATFDDNDFSYFFNQGSELGRNTASTISMPSISGSGGTSGINVSAEFMDNETKLSNEDLFKAISSGGVDTNNGFSAPDGTYQDEEAQSQFIRGQISSNQEFLDSSGEVEGDSSEEVVDNTNHSALAYGALMDARNQNPARKLSRDSAMFQVSRNTVTDAFTGQGAYFGDCSAESTTYQELDPTKIITNRATCMKPNKNNQSGCIVDRKLLKPTLNIIEGADNASLSMCGEDCVRLTLGKEGDDYLHQTGSCGIYKEKIAISLVKGNAVKKATVLTGSYDDQFRLKADGEMFYNGVHMGFPTEDGFPTTATGCEQNTSRTVPRFDATKAFQDAFADDDRIEFDYQVGVGGDGEAYAVVELIFEDPVRTHWEERFDYFPEGCNERLEEPDSYCTSGPFQCDDEVEWTIIDLGTWGTEDSNGKWETTNDKNTVKQTINGNPTSYLSEYSYELNSFKGYIKVNTDEDDDYIGFVFGVPEKGADLTDPDNSYFVVSWKQGNQEGAAKGLVLAKVTGPMGVIPKKHQLSKDDGTYEVLATNLGTGWADKKEYEFQLDIEPEHFTLSINDKVWIDTDGEFHSGRVGFYNSSQSDVSYSQVKQLYPAGLGRDAKYLFAPLWDGAAKFPVCMSAHREDYVCDPLKGKSLSMNGGSFSFSDIIHLDDGCAVYDEDDSCDAVSQECVEGWLDEESGTCYAWNVTYECQDTSNAVITKTRSNNTCLTEQNCIDGSCTVRADETNQDFTNALTTYATMNEIGSTKECSDPSDVTSCEVFSGEARWCGWDQLKVNDCCEQPSGVNTLNVFKLGQNLYTVTGYMASAEGAFGGTAIQTGLEAAGQAVEGAWDTLSSKAVDVGKSVWNTVSSKLTGAVGNTAGNTSANLVSNTGSVIGNFSSSVTTALSNFKNTLMQKIYDMLPETLQNAINSAATSIGGSGAAATGATAMNTIATSVMNVISFIGWVYAVYQLAKLAYTMLTACTEEEEDMGVQLLGKKCFKTHHEDCDKVFGVCTNRAKDFHCCYESVISRIIMEQAIVQLGWSAKSFRNEMGCRGLKISELSKVNFSKIDFTEWVEMMAESNELPIDKSMEDITGGNISNGFGRSDALERNQERSVDNAWVQRREEMEEADVGNNVDCTTRPRPKSCEQGAFTPNQ